MNPLVDDFLENTKNWKAELSMLRAIILDCGLIETLKWRQPCYTLGDSNITLIGSFKTHCAISFFKGVLLQDEQKLLHAPGENSQSMRYLKFVNTKQIQTLLPTIKAYIYEAISIEKQGLQIDKSASTDYELIEELQTKLKGDANFKKAFFALTPGRQRAYHIHFAGAKQSATRVARIANYTQRILDGKGILDCTCGLSNRMPSCDGSHKYLIKK